MPFSPRIVEARLALKLVRPEQFPALAMDVLEAGIDGSVRIEKDQRDLFAFNAQQIECQWKAESLPDPPHPKPIQLRISTHHWHIAVQ